MTDRIKLPMSIDLETLDLSPSAVILQIGAAVIDPNHPDEPSTFLAQCSLDSQQDRTQSEDTVAWWKRQPLATRELALIPSLQPECPTLKEGLLAFNEFFINTTRALNADIMPYGNGPAFDLGKLDHAYRSFGMTPPWFFRRERCQRTLEDIANTHFGIDVSHGPRTGTHHTADGDAVYQVLRIHNILCQLKEKGAQLS